MVLIGILAATVLVAAATPVVAEARRVHRWRRRDHLTELPPLVLPRRGLFDAATLGVLIGAVVMGISAWLGSGP